MLAGIAHHVPGCPAFVPGIRLRGHGRSLMADRRMLPALRYFWRITRRGETVEVRAFDDRLQQKFVLSLTVADRVRAIVSSEERRVGKECVSPFRYSWWRD